MNTIQYMAGVILSMLTVTTQAQYTIKIHVAGLPDAPATEALYLAGNFNNWNPQDERFRLQKDSGGHFFIELKDVDPAAYEFKFTRGGWNIGETDGDGNDLANRTITIQSDTTVEYSIAGWKDGFSATASSTLSKQVSILDTAFAVPQLHTTRRIWIYLPEDYHTSGKSYPVLYMHDGQNLFDKATSFAGEWGVDEAMDRFSNACIVVGIDNGGTRRMNEYNPNSTRQFGKGEGRAYLSFIVHSLKPFIDKKYHTLAGRQHTYMAGSSMGGLISFYAGLYYPGVFGVLGIFSPSFWIAPQLKPLLRQLAGSPGFSAQAYYFYAGGAEDSTMAANTLAVARQLKTLHPARVATVIDPRGKHNENTWGAAFPAFYKWINER